MRIFLDMDGVIADFVRPAISLHGRDPDEVLANWPAGTFDVAKVLGLTTKEFWKPITIAGWRWWVGLPHYSWSDDLLNVVQSFAGDDWLFASSPSRSCQSASGKIAWLQRRFGSHFRKYMLGEHKHLFAKSGAVLIDDREQSVIEFREAGGEAILFPQPWNSLGLVADPVAHIRIELALIAGL